MKHCKTINGLLKAIEKHEPARLTVYANGSSADGAWAVDKDNDRVHLNLGGGRFSVCSISTFERIRGSLDILNA